MFAYYFHLNKEYLISINFQVKSVFSRQNVEKLFLYVTQIIELAALNQLL